MIPLHRVLEPEIMDTEEDAREYDGINNAEVNRLFVAELARHFPLAAQTIVDLGSGPADIPIEIARQFPEAKLTAVEMGSHMLQMARKKLAALGFEKRVSLLAEDAKGTSIGAGSADLIISNSVVHHIAEPLLLFREVRRIGKSGAGVFIKDLRRPETAEQLDELVATHAKNDSAYARALFSHSLHAALKPEEVAEIARQAGFRKFSALPIGDRHWQFVGQV